MKNIKKNYCSGIALLEIKNVKWLIKYKPYKFQNWKIIFSRRVKKRKGFLENRVFPLFVYATQYLKGR